jgi:ethanolamine permease
MQAAKSMSLYDNDILITKKHIDEYIGQRGLKRVLIPRHLWGMGVGSVISGQYFGWNYGLALAGPAGFLISTVIITVVYIIVVIQISKLSAALPYAGGPYAFARKGLGPVAGFIAGISAMLEFLFAASAITLSIGSYLNFIIPGFPAFLAAALSFLLLILLNIAGLRKSAILQIGVTCLSLGGILLFIANGALSFDFRKFHENQGILTDAYGICASLPYAIWFYICIEGLAMTGEETRNPSKSVPFAFFISLATLIAASFSVLLISMGNVSWQELDGINYPLSFITGKTKSGNGTFLILFTLLTLCALLASLHGIINGYSRQTFALARAGYLPMFLSRIFKTAKTPYLSIILPGLAGILLAGILTVETMIVLSAFCGLLMYLLTAVSHIRLNYFHLDPEPGKQSYRLTDRRRFRQKPNLHLWVSIAALLLVSAVSAMLLLTDTGLILILLGVYAAVLLYYYFIARRRIKDNAPEELESVPDVKRVTIVD